MFVATESSCSTSKTAKDR